MMKQNNKDWVIILSFIVCLLAAITLTIHVIGLFIDTQYKMGVTITPNPKYLIELHYSDDLFKGVQTIKLEPKLFVSSKMVRYIYTAPLAMHLWHWTITRGDHILYGETIDRDVKAGDDIQFIYVAG